MASLATFDRLRIRRTTVCVSALQNHRISHTLGARYTAEGEPDSNLNHADIGHKPLPDAPLHAIGRRSRVHGHARRHRELGCDAEAVARSGWSSESSCDFLFLFSPPISVFDGRRYGIRVAPTLGLVFGDALRRDAPCDRTRHRTPSVTRCPPRSACFISFGSTLVDWRRRTARPIRPLSRTTDC